MLSEDRLREIEDIQIELTTKRRLAAQFKDVPGVGEKLAAEILESEEDLKAAQRLRKRAVAINQATPEKTLAALPKSVGEMLKDYLTKQHAPFTIEEAASAINADNGVNVTTSAVSQCVRRMKSQIREVKPGKGPLPAYYQGMSPTEAIWFFLNPLAGLGHTENEITDKTGLTLAVVGQILNSNPDTFEYGQDRKWRKKK